MDTDTNTAEAGHQEVLIVGAGAPDNALLHLGICPGEPLGDQVPDCGHASCPPPASLSKVTADALTSKIFISHCCIPHMPHYHVYSRSACRGACPPHVWINQWRHPCWRSSCSSSRRAPCQGCNGGPHLGGLVHGVGGGKLLVVGIIHGNGNYWFTGSA